MLLTVEELLLKNIVVLNQLVDSQEMKINKLTMSLDDSYTPNYDTMDLIRLEMDLAAMREAIREKTLEVSFKVLNINVILN